MVILKTYQQRAYTSKAGYERIAEVLRESARLYNAALEEWRGRTGRVSVCPCTASTENLRRYAPMMPSGAAYPFRSGAASSTLADAGLVPLYPFGATNAAGGVSYCLSMQPRTVAWLTQWATTRSSRPPHRLAYLRGFYNIQVWAGRELAVVDPKFTSQRCSGCGVVSAEHRQRKRYDCAGCGMKEDADINAARNILHKALAGRRTPDYRLPAASTRLAETSLAGIAN